MGDLGAESERCMAQIKGKERSASASGFTVTADYTTGLGRESIYNEPACWGGGERSEAPLKGIL